MTNRPSVTEELHEHARVSPAWYRPNGATDRGTIRLGPFQLGHRQPSPAVAAGRSPSALDRTVQWVARFAPSAVRLSLALVFLWFGVLKLVGDSPVKALIAATVPWGRPSLVVGLLGAVEVALGIGLLIGRAQRLLLLAVATHLCGTMLTFVMAPNLTMRHGNPFLLTADGEFVLKNLVLISAALLLVCQRVDMADDIRSTA